MKTAVLHHHLKQLPLDSRLTITVSGHSMRPLLHTGDAITIRITKADTLPPGSIVTVRTPTGLLTHRLTAIANDGATLRLWGDALPQPDPPIPSANLLGIVIERQRNGRILRLDQGKGQTLNGRLAQLAQWQHQHPHLRLPIRTAAHILAWWYTHPEE